MSLFGVPSHTQAEITRQLPLTAYLKSSGSQQTVPDGAYTITFSIYDDQAAGTPLWSETKLVPVENGIVATALGSTTPIPSSLTFNDGPYWLGIKVGSDDEMVPRVSIGSVPMALNSGTVGGASIGSGAGNVLLLDGAGNIGIQGGASFGGSLSVGGGITVSGSILPTGPGQNLGSSTNKFATLFVDSLSATNTTLNGTDSQVFTIDTNQTTDNSDLSSVRFYLGPTSGAYAALQWNGPSNRFDLLSRVGTNTAADLKVNNLVSGVATLQLPTSSDVLVGQSSTQSLSNKTLVSPTINGVISTTGLTIPAATIAGALTGQGTPNLAGFGTLNGQTISSAASLTGSLAVANGLTVSAGGLAVTGNSTITGSLSGVTDLGVTGNQTLAGNLNLGSNIIPTGATGTVGDASNFFLNGYFHNLTVDNLSTSSTSSSFTAPLSVVTTTSPQMTVKYDDSNYFSTAVSATGVTTFDGAGSAAAFVFNKPLTADTLQSSNATLTGGSINGVSVGSVTPASGAFTTLSANGGLSVSAGGAAVTGNSSVTGNLSVSGTVSGSFIGSVPDSSLTSNVALLNRISQTFSGSAVFSGGLTSGSGLTVTGDSGLTGNLSVSGLINGASISGGTVSGGSLTGGSLSGTALAGTGSFTITGGTAASQTLTLVSTSNGTKGNIQFFTSANSISPAGLLSLGSGNVTLDGATGNETIAGTFDATGNFRVNTNKFTVNASNGNTGVAGTLSVTGATTLGGLTAGTSTIDALTVTNASQLNGSLNVVGSSVLQNTLSVSGNVTLGSSSANTLTVNARLGTDLIPTADDVYNLGSPTNRYANFYAANAHFDNVTVQNSTSPDFIINSGNVSNDTENSSLQFSRGTVSPNATLMWDSSAQRFGFNQDVLVQGSTTLGSSSSNSTTLRGQVNLSDSNASATLLFGADSSLYRSAANTLATNANLLMGHVGAATSGVATQNSRSTTYQGSYWNGSSSVDVTGGVALLVQNATPAYGLALQTANTTQVFIDQSGNVGIGKTNPNKTLDISGNFGLSGAATFGSTVGVSGQLTASGGLSVSGGINNNGGGITAAGAVGATSVTASGAIQGGSITDGTATLSGGTLTGGVSATWSGSVTVPTISGSTSASANLTVNSTSNGTKGNIYLNGTASYIDLNGSLALTTLQPSGTGSLLQLGSGITGSSNGTYLGINAGSGYAGDLANLEVNGASRFKVNAAGDLTVAGKILGAGTDIGTSGSRFGTAYLTNLDVTNLTVGGPAAAFNTPVTVTTSTAPQLKLAYDASNYLAFSVNGSGQTTIDGSTGASFVFGKTVTANSLQSSSATISGGNINSTPIGGSSASSGAFTTLAASSGLTVTGASTITGTLGGLTGLTVVSGGASITGTTSVTGNLTASGTINTATISGGTLSGGSYSGTALTPTGNYSIGTSSYSLTLQGSVTNLYASVPASTQYGVVNIGGGATAFNGTAGSFSGNTAQGTELAINAAGNFSGNLIDLQTGGVSQLRVDAAGVTRIAGNTTIVGSLSAAGITSSAASSLTGGLNNNSGGITNAGSITGIGTNLTAAGAVTLQATAGTLALAATGSNIITASTNGTEALRIDASGNVGIGTASPTTQLTVAGKLPTGILGSLNSTVTPVNGPTFEQVQGRYLYIVGWESNNLGIFDISNPASPVNVSSTYTGISGGAGLYVSGKYAYVAGWFSGAISIMDISNPAAPVKVGVVSTGSGAQNLVVQGKYAYVVNKSANTVSVVDVSNPSAPFVAGSVSTGASTGPYTIAVQGKYAYVGNQTSGALQVVDISNPAAPALAGSVSVTTPQEVVIQGKYAYVATGTANTVQVVDISNPASPSAAGSVSLGAGTDPLGLTVEGHYAFTANYSSNTMSMVDISTPTSPSLVGAVSTTSSAGPDDVKVQGRYAYVIHRGPTNSAFSVFDLGGSFIQQLETGALQASTLAVDGVAQFGQGISVVGGISASGSIGAASLGINGGSTFSGNLLSVGSVSANALTIDQNGMTTINSFGLNTVLRTTTAESVFTDVAGALNAGTATAIFRNSAALNDRTYFGYVPSAFTSLSFTKTAGTGGAVTWEVCTAVTSGTCSTWTAISGGSDGTSGLTASGTVSWTNTGVKATVNGISAYWLRATVTTAMTAQAQGVVNIVNPAATTVALLIQGGGATASGTLSTAGTQLAVNAQSGFAGNLADLQVNGTSKFKVDASGNTTTAGTLTVGGSFAISGALTGATTITASGLIQGGSLSDGTATLSGGALSGATTGAFGTSVTTPILNGGASSSGNITINSTSNGTKGNVYFNGTTAYVDGTSSLFAAGVTASTSVTAPIIQTASGNLSLQASTGIVALNKASTQNSLQVYAADNASYAQITHDGTNGIVSSSAGELQLSAQGSNQFILGDVGTAVNLVFQNASTISGLGANAITLGVAGDSFNLNTSGVTYNVGTLTASNATLNTSATGSSALAINGPSGLTANLLDLKTNGSLVASVSSAGALSLSSSISATVANLSSGTTSLIVSGAPTNTATTSLIQVGNTIVSGNTSTNGGTYIGINQPASGAGSAADFLNLQNNGTSELKVTSAGVLTVNGTVNGATLTGGTLSASAVNGLSVASGTVTVGTWQGSSVGVQYGGTGVASATANGILYGNGTSALGVTAAGSTGQCLVGTTGSAPSWASCAAGVTLQTAYAAGNTISTLASTDLAVTLANNANFTVNIPTSQTGKFAVQNNGTDVLAVTSSGTTAASPLTLSGTGAAELLVTGAPTNSATSSLVRLGGAIASGNTATNGGTYLGVNRPSSGAGSAADFLNFQSNGVSQLKVVGSAVASSGTDTSLTLSPTVAQTSTAGFNALTVNPTVTGTGSGTKNLLSLQANGSQVASLGMYGTYRFNVWNFSSVQQTTGTGQTDLSGYTDVTSSANGSANWPIITTTTHARTYFGFDQDAFQAMYLSSAVAAAGSTVSWEFWNGSTWTSLTNVCCGVSSNFTGSGAITWGGNTPSRTTVNGISAYWVRVTAATTMTTAPTGVITIQNPGANYNVATLIQPSNVASDTNWSVAGTLLGMAENLSFAGNFIDLHSGGTSVFSVTSAGDISASSLSVGASGVTAYGPVTALNISGSNLQLDDSATLGVGIQLQFQPVADGTLAEALLGTSNLVAGNAVTNGGTYLGINQPASSTGSAADFLNFQHNDVSVLKVSSAGTLTAGTWQGNTVAVSYGGTGVTSATANGILYGNGTSGFGVTAAGTSGQCLKGATGSAPTWASCTTGNTLQTAYAGGNTISTASSTDLAVTLANNANFTVNIPTSQTGKFAVQNNGTDVFKVTSSGSTAGSTVTSTAASAAFVANSATATAFQDTSSPAASSQIIQLGAALGSPSANGTFIGINPASFTGNFAEYQVNGVSKYKLDASGNLTTAGNLVVSGTGTHTFAGTVQLAALTSTAGIAVTTAANGNVSISPNGSGNVNVTLTTGKFTAGDGGTTNYTSIDQNGAITFNGSARPYSLLSLMPKDATIPSSNSCASAQVDDTNHSYTTLDCVAGADKWDNWQFQMPHNYASASNIIVDVLWEDTAGSSTSTGAQFDIGYTSIAAAGTWNGASRTDVTGAVVNSAGQNKITDSTVTLTAPSINANDLVSLRVTRKGSTDTLADTARILEVRLKYLVTN